LPHYHSHNNKKIKFFVNLEFDKASKSIVLDPSVNDIEETLLECLGFVLLPLEKIPNYEPAILNSLKIGPELSEATNSLLLSEGEKKNRLVVDDEKVSKMTSNLKNYLRNSHERTVAHLKIYSVYVDLFSADKIDMITNFLGDTHAFEEYVQEIDKLRRIGSSLSDWPRKIQIELFELRTDDIHRAFYAQTQHLAAKFISALVLENINAQKR
jgi:hypothetical protein